MPILAVNIDHVATLRQARLGKEPDPLTAAHMAELAGAKAIIAHLREDRRHIQDRDVELIAETVKTRFNFEMAATDEMRDIALRVAPQMVCLVPEKREELTTEGGLAVAGNEAWLREYCAPLKDADIKISLFIDPEPRQVEASLAAGAEYVELHTGAYAAAPYGEEREAELIRLLESIRDAQEAGLKVNLGHGLNYDNVQPFADVPGIHEYSIGHAIISRAVFTGLPEAVAEMAALVESFAE